VACESQALGAFKQTKARAAPILSSVRHARRRGYPVVPAGKLGPIAGVTAAHHFGRDIESASETLRHHAIAVRRARTAIARGAGADLDAPDNLAADQSLQRIRRRGLSSREVLGFHRTLAVLQAQRCRVAEFYV